MFPKSDASHEYTEDHIWGKRLPQLKSPETMDEKMIKEKVCATALCWHRGVC